MILDVNLMTKGCQGKARSKRLAREGMPDFGAIIEKALLMWDRLIPQQCREVASIA